MTFESFSTYDGFRSYYEGIIITPRFHRQSLNLVLCLSWLNGKQLALRYLIYVSATVLSLSQDAHQ